MCDKKTYCVYKHVCPIGKVYIGITCQDVKKRWLSKGQGYKDNDYFFKAIKKYGWENKKPVIQLSLSGDFIAEYPSAKQAERETGFYNGNIIACCKGKKKTVGGYKWQYATLMKFNSEFQKYIR